MKILVINKDMQNFDTYTNLFKYISKEGYFVDKIENGKLTLNNNKETVDAEFGELNKENSLNPFNEEIFEYRELLRGSIQSLTELGIKIDPQENEKLKQIFSFLN